MPGRRRRTSESLTGTTGKRKGSRSSRDRREGSGGSNLGDVLQTVDIGIQDDREAIVSNEISDEGEGEDEEDEEEGDEEDEDEEEYLEEEDEEEEEGVKVKLLQVEGVGRPLVWVRIKPSNTFEHDLFRIGDDDKKLQILMEPGDRLQKSKSGTTTAFTFNSDGILQTPNQEEIFQKTVQELVEKAMEGISGAVICMGPDLSGKNYTLFGPLTKYQDRGLVPRALEKIFEIIDAKREDFEYHIILSMFDIHKEKIKDLITLGPYELGRVGDFGPKGLFYEEITSLQHGHSLIIRGITGQDMIHQQLEACSKFHTIVYIDILAKELRKPDDTVPIPDVNGNTPNPNTNSEELKEWRSRITFSKIASIPVREKPLMAPKYPPDHCVTGGSRGGACGGTNWACPGNYCFDDYGQVQPKQNSSRSRSKSASKSSCSNSNCSPKCCRGPTGELGEGISIRKDMYFLEQMFIRAHDLRKIHDYYNKLQTLGMYMLMRPPKMAPSQYFRQSKLTHCLKDIVSGTTNVRLILHIRPERKYLQSTLEAIRFAARARCIPVDHRKKQGDCGDECLTEAKIANMCEEMGIQDPRVAKDGADTDIKISPEKLKEVLAQATAFFDEKLDSLEGACKDQVKSLFETFRETLNHVFDKDKEFAESRLNAEEEEEEHAEGDANEFKSTDDNGNPVTNKDVADENQAGEDADEEEGAGSLEEQSKEDGGEGDGAEDETTDKTADVVQGPKTSFDIKSEAHQFQELCWFGFKESEKGQPLVEQFVQRQDNLKKVLGDHDEAQKELAVGMGKLTELELQLDILEQDRKFKGQLVDEHGNPLAASPEELQVRNEIHAVFQTEHELMKKLKEIRIQIQEGKCHLEAGKLEVEHVFKVFCMETHGKHADLVNLPLSTLDHAVTTVGRRWSRIHRIKSPRKPDPLEDASFDLEAMAGEKEIAMAKEFENLKRIARQQALQLLQAYPKRPPWIDYY